jgi:hypothetical protein
LAYRQKQPHPVLQLEQHPERQISVSSTLWSRTFTVDSNQCTTHRKVTHKDGPNQIYKHMKEGREGNWGMLKNRHIQPEEVTLILAETENCRYHPVYGPERRDSDVDMTIQVIKFWKAQYGGNPDSKPH